MRKKNRRPIQVDPETRDILETLSREIAQAQDARVSMGETVKRMRNIPGTRDILIEDARAKRRLKR